MMILLAISCFALILSSINTNNNKCFDGSDETTTLYLIRHAEAVSNVQFQQLKDRAKRLQPLTPNEAFSGWKLLLGKGDSELTQKGKHQIEELREILVQNNFWDDVDLVVHSPLIRARETCLGLLEGVHASVLSGDIVVDEPFNVAIDGCKDNHDGRYRPLVVCCCLDELKEVRPTENILAPLGARSPRLYQRIEKFQDWITAQLQTRQRQYTPKQAQNQNCEEEQKKINEVLPPPQKIVVVGHSEYFKEMLKFEERFQNCDVWQVSFKSGEAITNGHSKWSDPKLLYRLPK